jgi:hypothetical protein
MNERMLELAKQAGLKKDHASDREYVGDFDWRLFGDLIVQECMDQVEQAKNSHFVSLDDAKRMAHFVNVTKKKVQKHFEVE